MDTAEKREAKHQKFSQHFGDFMRAEAEAHLAASRLYQAQAQARLDALSVEVEALRVARDATEQRHDIEALREWEKLTLHIIALQNRAELAAQWKEHALDSISTFEQAFQVETEFRGWGYPSIFTEPKLKKKAPTRARKRR